MMGDEDVSSAALDTKAHILSIILLRIVALCVLVWEKNWISQIKLVSFTTMSVDSETCRFPTFVPHLVVGVRLRRGSSSF